MKEHTQNEFFDRMKTDPVIVAFLCILMMLHGLVHVSGFTEAFGIDTESYLNQHISSVNGIVWLITALTLLASGVMLLISKDHWWILAGIGALLSQYLIITTWQDAKFGTIANVVILFVAIVGYAIWRFHRQYLRDVAVSLSLLPATQAEFLTADDIAHLPQPVQKYIRYSGSLGKPKVEHFTVRFSGRIRRDIDSPWMTFTSEQHNFQKTSTRLFHMDAQLKSVPTTGYHHFRNGVAVMDIRVLSLFEVQYQAGPEMNAAETVTFFNDMCCMAPATLIDERINWREIDSHTVDATFSNNGITISARLAFDQNDRLINFISEDRYATNEDGTMRRLPWSTPLRDPQDYHGYTLSSYADAIYRYPNGEMVYGEFHVRDVVYNPG